MKLREFWIWGSVASEKPIDFKEVYEAGYGATQIHVREVSPELDAAIQKMVEALEAYANNEATAFMTKWAKDALEAWRKVNE